MSNTAISCLIAVPAFAADHAFDLTGWAARVDPNSTGTCGLARQDQSGDFFRA
jgi:hypothetical protein